MYHVMSGIRILRVLSYRRQNHFEEPPQIVLIPEHNRDEKYSNESRKENMTPRPPVEPQSRNLHNGGQSPVKNFENFRVENKKSKGGPSIERLKDDKQVLGMHVEALRAQLEVTHWIILI